jgi:hypothetical protein
VRLGGLMAGQQEPDEPLGLADYLTQLRAELA